MAFHSDSSMCFYALTMPEPRLHTTYTPQLCSLMLMHRTISLMDILPFSRSSFGILQYFSGFSTHRGKLRVQLLLYILSTLQH
jgi:hypothetical protein